MAVSGWGDFYAVVEGHEQVLDSLVIDTTSSAPRRRRAAVFPRAGTRRHVGGGGAQLRQALRTELSPRHVPDRFVVVQEIPRTLNGKKCEVPVKRILAGVDPDQAVSRDALQNPESLATFIEMARR